MSNSNSNSDILNITNKVNVSDEIIKKEFHSYYPYAGTNYKNNDEIRIRIQAQDIYTLVSDSFLAITGKFTHTDPNSKLVNMGIIAAFDEMRIEINNVVIDKVRDVARTIIMKSLACFTQADARMAEIAGFQLKGEPKIKDSTGEFIANIPLKLLLGFAEIYRKVLINCKIEIILHRTHSDENCYMGNDGKIEISEIVWHVPHIHINEQVKLKLLRSSKLDKSTKIAFRQWDLYELPALKENSTDKWNISTSNQIEKPRYFIIAFQTDRNKNKAKNASEFDHATIRNYKVFLNTDSYPYDRQQLDFSKGKISSAYHPYSTIQSSYYGREINDPIMDIETYKNSPIFVIDASHQNESIKTGSVDVQLELESTSKFPAKTTAYALIIHDVLFEYNQITGIVNKLTTY